MSGVAVSMTRSLPLCFVDERAMPVPTALPMRATVQEQVPLVQAIYDELRTIRDPLGEARKGLDSPVLSKARNPKEMQTGGLVFRDLCRENDGIHPIDNRVGAALWPTPSLVYWIDICISAP